MDAPTRERRVTPGVQATKVRTWSGLKSLFRNYGFTVRFFAAGSLEIAELGDEPPEGNRILPFRWAIDR
jgi:hypothetical protein